MSSRARCYVVIIICVLYDFWYFDTHNAYSRRGLLAVYAEYNIMPKKHGAPRVIYTRGANGGNRVVAILFELK